MTACDPKRTLPQLICVEVLYRKEPRPNWRSANILITKLTTELARQLRLRYGTEIPVSGNTAMQQTKLLIAALFLISPFAVNATLINYDSGLDEWSVTDWVCGECSTSGLGPFAPSTFTGYTSTNGVAMLLNSNQGWWIGDVSISTASSYWADLSRTLTVTGATWGGTVTWYSNVGGGSNFYAAYFELFPSIFDATGLGIGDPIDGVFSWGGRLFEPTLYYTPNSVPVPEPGTFALFGIGLLGIGLARRRKKA